MTAWKIAGLGLLLASVAVASSERLEQGRKVYEESCASCHDTGEKSAPVTGRSEDWAKRSKLWEAILFEHANSGYLEMPAKGGVPGLTEYDVDAAAEYMLTVSHPEMQED
jgi:cytochrome c5